MTAARRLGGGHRFLRTCAHRALGRADGCRASRRGTRTSRPCAAAAPRDRRRRGAPPFAARLRLITARSASSSSRGRVAVVPEPPPHEGELAPVRLERVPGADLRCVCRELALVARERLVELGRDRDERAGSRDLDRERAHLVAVTAERERAGALERLVDRGRPGARVAVHVATDPRPERERRRRAGQALAPDAQQLGRGVEQAVLEEPERVADLVRDPEAVVSHLVGLPEERHLLCNASLGLRRAPRARRAGRRGRPAVPESGCARAARCGAWSPWDARSAPAGSTFRLPARRARRPAGLRARRRRRRASRARCGRRARPRDGASGGGAARPGWRAGNRRRTPAARAPARPVRRRRGLRRRRPARRGGRRASRRGSTRRARAATLLPARRARGRGSLRAAGRRL